MNIYYCLSTIQFIYELAKNNQIINNIIHDNYNNK